MFWSISRHGLSNYNICLNELIQLKYLTYTTVQKFGVRKILFKNKLIILFHKDALIKRKVIYNVTFELYQKILYKCISFHKNIKQYNWALINISK